MAVTKLQPFIIAIIGAVAIMTSVVAHYTDVIDIRCNVNVNSTSSVKLDGERGHYDSCFNATFKEDNDKLSQNQRDEAWDCFWKCSLQKSEVFSQDGKHQSKAVQQYYESYSNATSDYIKKVVELHENCYLKASHKAEELQRKRNDSQINNCKMYGLYDSCMFQACIDVNIEEFCEIPTDNSYDVEDSANEIAQNEVDDEDLEL